MARKFFATTVAVVLGMTVVSCDADCSYYEDLKELQQKEEKTPVTPTDTVANNDDEWETPMQKYYRFNNGIVDSHIETEKNGIAKEYIVEVAFEANLGGDKYIITNDATRSTFVSLSGVNNTIYGDWKANEENDSIRKVTTTQAYNCNLYSRDLIVENAQAYRMINGKREEFLMPVVVSSFAGHSSDVQQIERNDSIFDRETIKDSVRISFSGRADIKPFCVSAKTVIDHFVKIKEPEVENMPEPTVRTDEDIISITDRTASPIHNGKSFDWYEVSLVKTVSKTYVVVNGGLASVWNNTELAVADWISAMYDTVLGKWVPCLLVMDGNGWTYQFQLSDNTERHRTVPMEAAVTTGLKSFVKENTAKQTPFLSQGSVKRTFSDGDFYTVNGNYPYTVAHK